MNDKNLAMMDEIMGTITQFDEWADIQIHDPMITAADDQFEAAMERAKAFIPKEFYDELYDTHEAKASALGDAGILFGLRVADVIRDVASRPADLSRHILKRIERRSAV